VRPAKQCRSTSGSDNSHKHPNIHVPFRLCRLIALPEYRRRLQVATAAAAAAAAPATAPAAVAAPAAAAACDDNSDEVEQILCSAGALEYPAAVLCDLQTQCTKVLRRLQKAAEVRSSLQRTAQTCGVIPPLSATAFGLLAVFVAFFALVWISLANDEAWHATLHFDAVIVVIGQNMCCVCVCSARLCHGGLCHGVAMLCHAVLTCRPCPLTTSP
jgi:hypothetical protein